MLFYKTMRRFTTILLLAATLLITTTTEALAQKSDKVKSVITYSAAEKIEITNSEAFDCKIASHKFDKDGLQGTITFKGVLTTIGAEAFYNCATIESIILPESVVEIGNYAFSGCSSLSTAPLGGNIKSIGNYAFSGCSKITSVTIPEGVTSIGSSAFHGCRSLKTVVIPSSVTSIGDFAFAEAPQLSNVSVGRALSCIKSMNDCFPQLSKLTILDDITEIHDEAFKGCGKLESISIPASVKRIGKRAFYGCWALNSITLPEDLTTLSDELFAYCQSLREIELPKSLTALGEGVFANCSKLSNIALSNSITSIPQKAFNGCSGLRYIYLPDSLTTIGQEAFSGCSALNILILPDSLTSIGDMAFTNCTGLKKIEFGSGLNEVNLNIFKGCNNIESVTLKRAITLLGNSSLDTKNLNEVIFGEGFTSLDSTLLDGFSRAKTITLGDNITTLAEGTFSNLSGLKRLVLGGGITSFNTSAISGCYDIEAVVLHQNTREIVFDDSITIMGSHMDDETFNASIFEYPEGEAYELESVVLGKNTQIVEEMPWCKRLTIFRGLQELYTYFPGEVYVDELATIFEINGPVEESNRVWPCSCIAGSNIYDLNGNLLIKSNPQSITIPSSVTRIGRGTLAYCTNLTSITISEGVTTIGEYAFYECENLKTVKLPNSLREIEYGAFEKAGLQHITIPKGVDEIGEDIFMSCEKLSSITLLNSYYYLGSRSLWGTPSPKIYDCSNLPMSKVTQSNIAGVYSGKNNIDGRTVTTPLLLFDNGTYMKTRLDTCYEQYYEVGRYTINGNTLTLTIVGHHNLNGEFRRISGSETVVVNTKNGTLGKYGNRRRLWRDVEEYHDVTAGDNDCPCEGDYTIDMFYNCKSFTYEVIDALDQNVKVRWY